MFTGTPPYAFTFGLGGVLLFPLHAGASTLLVEKATPAELADLIDEHGVTICFTAPTAYKAMLADAARKTRSAPCARRSPPASTCPKATWEAFRDATGVEIIDGIGATEMLHIFISASGADIRPGSTGRAVPGYAATIVDDDGHELPAGRAGRLAVQGPTGCRYLDDPRQRDYVRNGWNITGDTFLRDDDGYFWYQARSDDMIISSGYNIAAPEVEEALLKHPARRRVRGRRRARRGARPCREGVRRRARATVECRSSCRTSSRPRSRRTSTPGHRVRDRAAEDRDREAAALPAAGAVGHARPSPMPDHSPRHLI